MNFYPVCSRGMSMVGEGQGQETRMLAIDRLWLSKKKRTTSKQFNQNQKKRFLCCTGIIPSRTCFLSSNINSLAGSRGSQWNSLTVSCLVCMSYKIPWHNAVHTIGAWEWSIFS